MHRINHWFRDHTVNNNLFLECFTEKKEKMRGAEMLPVLPSEEPVETGRKQSVVVPLVSTRNADDTINPMRYF